MKHKQNPDIQQKVIGRSVPRVDAPDKATGKAIYTGALNLKDAIKLTASA